MSDSVLIAAMREGHVSAWQEFMMRFRPFLLRYGSRARMDPAEWSACVDTVLEEAAMRWAVDGEMQPKSITGYLLRAATFHRRTIERNDNRRARRHREAVRESGAEGAVLSLCSEAAVRDSYGPSGTMERTGSATLRRFCELLCVSLSGEERGILARIGDGMPHREIAAELGVGYETGRKRIQRLCTRVRALVPAALAQMNQSDRVEIERFLTRLRPERSKGADDDV